MTLSREESFKKLDNMLEAQGYVWTRMAFTHLVDVGFRHFTAENIEETVKTIRERKQDENSVPILSPESEVVLVQTAAVFAQMNIWDVLEWARWKIIAMGPEEKKEVEEEEEERWLNELPEGCLSECEVNSLKSDLEDAKDAVSKLRCQLDNAVEYLESVEEALDNIESIANGDGY